ncbi:hypothetical protein SUDANB95_03476 [Actinosynnema sp. ALI-1.44]
MRRFSTGAAAFALLAAAVTTGFAQAAPEQGGEVVPMISSSLVVNEVATRGPLGNLDEFIEIRNLSTQSFEPAGQFEVRIYSQDGTLLETVDFPAGTQLAPRGQEGDILVLVHENFAGTIPPNVTQVPLPEEFDIPDLGGVAIYTVPQGNQQGQKIDGVAFSNNVPTTRAREGQAARPMTNLNVDPLLRVASARDVLSTDTDNNRVDFTLHTATPGALN